jgi:hypothetical protein
MLLSTPLLNNKPTGTSDNLLSFKTVLIIENKLFLFDVLDFLIKVIASKYFLFIRHEPGSTEFIPL